MLALILYGLDEIDWAALEHAYGAAEDVPGLLRAIAVDDDAAEAVGDLDTRLLHQGGFVCSAATTALPYLVDLAEAAHVTARPGVLELIGRLAEQGGMVHDRHVDPGWAAAWSAAVPRLLALIGDADVAVRSTLPATLSRAAGEADLVVPALRERWRDDDDEAVRLALILAAGELGPGCTVDVLPELLIWLRDLSGHAEAQTRLAAAIALTRVVPSHRLGADLDTLTRAVRDARLQVWGDVPWVTAYPVDLLNDSDGTPTRVIGWIDEQFGDDVTSRTDFSLTFLGDRDGDRRMGAVRAAAALLATWRSPVQRLLPAIAERTTDRAGTARAYATHVIAAIGDEADDHVDLLAARLGDDRRLSRYSEERISDIAAWGLAWRHDPRCLPHLVERLSGPNLGYGTSRVFSGADRPFFYSTDPPAVQEVLGPLCDHADVLLPVIRDRLRGPDEGRTNGTFGGVHQALTDILEQWGEASAPAVPELIGLLATDRHLYAVKALAAIGPAASDVAPVLRKSLRRPSDEPADEESVVLSWAYWKITDDPEPVLIAIGQETGRWSSYLADLGPLAAAHADRIYDLLDGADARERINAANTLFRITRDPTDAAETLRDVVHSLTDDRYRPVIWEALRYLADMGEAAGHCDLVLREALASDRRHYYYGKWRRLAQDQEFRRLATRILAAT
ncbi:hypothetical protein GCM10023085_17140 [Actinomadura viridis]